MLGMLTSTAFAAGDSTVYYDASIKAPSLGNYQFNVETHEIPSHEYLPIVSKDYFPVTTAQFQTEVDNTAPSATYESKLITNVDVIFAFGKYDKTEQVKAFTSTFKSELNQASNYVNAQVKELESAFESEFALHTTWDTQSDMDTHITMYDNSGKELIHIYYGNQSGLGLKLDKDDTTGSNSQYQNLTEPNGSRDGEWFTMDFPNIPSSATKMEIYIRGFRGSSNTRVTLVDKSKGEITTWSDVYVGNHQNVTIGTFVKENGGWSFIKANGEKFSGSSAVPLGETLQEVEWRSNSVRFIVHFTDTIPDELKEKGADYQYTVQKVLNSNAYLINIGTSSNKSYLDDLLNAVSGSQGKQGTFIYDSSSASTTMRQVENYILEIVRNMAKPTQWILVNTPVNWKTLYNDQEHDLPLNFGEHDGSEYGDSSDVTLASAWGVAFSKYYKSDKILAEKWRFRHNYTYYDNATHQETFHDVWLSDPVDIFPEPGLYRINYKRKDNPFYPDVDFSNPFDEYRYWSTDYDPVVQGD